VSANASHLARWVGLASEVLSMPTLPRLNIWLAVVARAATPVVATVTTPRAQACIGWPELAGPEAQAHAAILVGYM
jgi:hypothetical protein